MILALLLAGAQAAVPPAPAPPAPAASALLSADTATRLLAIVFPVDRAIGEQRRAHREALADRIAGDTRLGELAARDPAFRPALERDVDQVVDATYRRLTPTLQGDVSAIYRQALTEAEGRELVAIFASPTGRKLVAAMHRGTAQSDAITPNGIGDDGRAEALGALGPEDRPVLERIASQPALMAKMRAAADPIRAASNRFIERCTAELGTALPRAIDAAVARFDKAPS